MAHLTRLGALVAAGTLTTSGLVASLAAPAQAADTDSRPVSIGASWIESQLTNGLFHYPDSGFGAYDDYGLSIDAGLSLATIGDHDAKVSAIADALAPHITTSYAQSDEFDFNPPFEFVQHGYYAGPTAKALVFAQVSGQDTATWGGLDLVDAVEDRVIGSGASLGRIADDSSFGDFGNVIGQAFAARGLSNASPASAKAGDVIAFLVKQQCTEGYFRLNFTSDKDASDQTCDGGVAAGHSTPDTDATALAVLQLLAIPEGDRPQAATDALDAAEAWLLEAQRADGSFGGGASTEAPNTNSTGLAGWALGELGDDAAATKAATWVRGHQIDEQSACSSAISDQTPGAIGYDDAAVAAGLADGITLGTLDQWRRSSAPTLPVLRWAPAATSALTLTGPTGYLKAGRAATYQVSGAAPGDKVCVSGIGASHRIVAPTSGSFSVALTMPAGTANRTATAAVTGHADSLLVQVLGAKTLTVTPARHRKHRGTKVRVVVTGLAPAEQVRLRVRGVTVRTGVADPSGRFSRLVKVGHRLGKARIAAWGQFSTIRKGHAVIRVVR